MTAGGPNTPLLETVEKSGFPFQLAVLRELRRLGEKHSWPVVATEVPVGEEFADMVLLRPGLLGVIEAKRVEGEKWNFLVPRGACSNIPRCRIEWHNSRAAELPLEARISIRNRATKVFCSECNMAEGSYESSVAVLPKGKAAHSLEALSNNLLSITHALGDMFALKYDNKQPTYLIPVVVTNAELMVCEYDVGSLDIDLGKLGQADFKPVDFVRFRKTLVSRASNDYEWDRQMTLEDWTSDRERTVFVVSPKGLDQFLSGFRAFGPAGGKEYPDPFLTPPTYGSGSRRQ
jgi:hypothetical protein